MKNILVATDFSSRSVPAVTRGAALAEASGAKLTVVHIVDDDQQESLAAAAEAEAQSLFEKLSRSMQGKYGVDVSTLVAHGDPHVEILNAAQNAGADVIIVGAHRRNLLRNTFVGTTAERTIRASAAPVLVARAEERAPYQRPLIALDLNESDLHPFTAAAALGVFDEERASVVFVYDMHGYHLLRQAGVTDAELQKYFKEEEAMVRPRALDILKSADIKPAGVILKPALFNACDPVLEAAEEYATDLIVVGTRRKKAFDRFRLGSVSEGILRRAGVDVLVVPPTDD